MGDAVGVNFLTVNPEPDKSKVTSMPLDPDSVLRIQQPALQALRGIQRAMEEAGPAGATPAGEAVSAE